MKLGEPLDNSLRYLLGFSLRDSLSESFDDSLWWESLRWELFRNSLWRMLGNSLNALLKDEKSGVFIQYFLIRRLIMRWMKGWKTIAIVITGFVAGIHSF